MSSEPVFCRIYNTATRENPITFSGTLVTVDVDVDVLCSTAVDCTLILVAVAVVADSVWVGVDVVVDDLLDSESSYRIPFKVASERTARTGVGSVSERDGVESSINCTDRRVLLVLSLVTSLKATSSFSVVQETLLMLKRAMIVTESRVILNFSLDSSNRIGSELPIVAFDPLFTRAVVQLLSPAILHCEPV